MEKDDGDDNDDDGWLVAFADAQLWISYPALFRWPNPCPVPLLTECFEPAVRDMVPNPVRLPEGQLSPWYMANGYSEENLLCTMKEQE